MQQPPPFCWSSLNSRSQPPPMNGNLTTSHSTHSSTPIPRPNAIACLSTDQISHLQELLLTALTANFSQSKLEVVKTAHAVLAKNLDPANAGRLTKATLLLLKRTQPDQVQLGADGNASHSEPAPRVLRLSITSVMHWAVGQAWAIALTKCAQLVLVLRSATAVIRRPAKGWQAMKTLQVPRRSYS